MLSVLLLVALAGQPSSAPDVTVVLESSDVVVVRVHPSRQRTVKTIVLQPDASERAPKPKPMTPRALEVSPKGRVQATFDLPLTTFHVVVTLDDGSTRRVDKGFIYRVGPSIRDLPPLHSPIPGD